MQNSGIASLHSGLIERARPRPEPTGILKLRATGAPPAQVRGPVLLPQVKKPAVSHLSVIAETRRFGLTLRVDHEMRQDLARYTEHTGRTVQSVLHAALSGYLDRANVIMQHKE